MLTLYGWWQSIEAYMPVILIVLFMLSLLLLVLFLIQRRRTSRLLLNLRSLIRGVEGANLEELLGKLGGEVDSIITSGRELEGRLSKLEAKAQRFVQGTALERYNAFPDASGELSFSLALIDGQGNGAVISGLYGREEYRIYAKPLKNGSSYYPLTEEEKKAIHKAEESILGRR